MKLNPNLSYEQLGHDWLVVSHPDGAAHHLTDGAATVISSVHAGQPIPPGHDDAISALVDARILTPTPGWSRRQVLTTAAAAAAVGISSASLPTLALASSPGGSGSGSESGPDPVFEMTWSGVNVPTSVWSSVAYGGGTWVAVASLGTPQVMTSPDGITWTDRASPNRLDFAWTSVAFGEDGSSGPLWVAVANRPFGDASTDGRVMTSADGVSWTETRNTPTGTGVWQSVAYGNGLWVAVADNNIARTVMTSTNGTAWTDRGILDKQLEAVAFGQVDGSNGWVAVGVSGYIVTSTDPTDNSTWTQRTTPAGVTGRLQSVAYGNGLWVAVTTSGDNRLITSPDGINWTVRTPAEDNQWSSVAFGADDDGNPLWVAVSLNGENRVMTSPDGITWTPQSATEANQWHSVAYNGAGVWVAVSSNGTNRVMRFPAVA